MTSVVFVPVLTAFFDSAYIFSEFIKSSGIKNQSTITFTSSEILAENENARKTCFTRGHINGLQVDLQWIDIPVDKQRLTLQFDVKDCERKILKNIKKKSRCGIQIHQVRSSDNPDAFDTVDSSDKFEITVNIEHGTHKLVAQRTNEAVYHFKDPINAIPLRIPVNNFNSMTMALPKTQNDKLYIKIYDSDTIDDKGILFCSTGRVVQEFGNVPIEDKQIAFIKPLELNQPEVYLLEGRDIANLANIGFHSEGSILVYYTANHSLKFTHVFGAFGQIDYIVSPPNL